MESLPAGPGVLRRRDDGAADRRPCPERLGLRVISRTSTEHYKNARKPVPTIASELQVDAVIEGSVIHASERVQIIAKLIRGSTGEVIWTESFERDLRDVLTLQRDIARAITSRVDVTLTPEAQARLTSARPVDPELHQTGSARPPPVSQVDGRRTAQGHPAFRGRHQQGSRERAGSRQPRRGLHLPVRVLHASASWRCPGRSAPPKSR